MIFKERYLFKLVRFLLIISGLWPLEIPNISKFWQVIFKIYYVVAHVIYLTSPFAFGGALVVDYGVRNAQAAEDFSRMVFVILIVFKLNIIRSQKIKNIINLVTSEEINIMKSTDKHVISIYQAHVAYCTKMVFFIVVFLWAAGLINMFNGLYELNKWSQTMQFTNQTTLRPHIIPFWFPFNKEKHFILAMAYQIWHIYQTLAINSAILALINSVMVFLRANLRILQYYVENFDSIDFISNKNNGLKCNHLVAEKNFKRLIMRHQQLIDWVQDLDDSFKSILLLEYCVTSIQLATTLIQIIQFVHIPFNVTFFMHCLLQLFGIAWNANEILLESSTGLLESLYASNWYVQNKEIRYLIYFMMIRCKRPLIMRIGPLGTMNLNAAVSRVKLAYTCLSVLKVTTEK